MRKVLGNAKLTFDELNTVLIEIEGTLNSRPLTYLYDELEEGLTPSHLLFGHRLSPLSENVDIHANFDNVENDKIQKRFLYLTRKLNNFWNRWRKEYVTDLRESHKLTGTVPVHISNGDVVLIYDANEKRGFCKKGIVQDIIVGKDGVVRGSSVRKMGRGKPETLNRPLQKLFPLEIACRDHEIRGWKDECQSKRECMRRVMRKMRKDRKQVWTE